MKGIVIETRQYYKRHTVTFNASSNLQPYTIPATVTELEVDCVGSSGYPINAPGGDGGRVQCKLPVTPGTTLYFMVGAVPSTVVTAEYNASDIRTDGTGVLDSTSLSSRLVVAGGGGNAGNTDDSAGYGGGLTAGDASTSSGGKGGTQSSGGAAGEGYHLNGNPGTFGLGGNGVTYSNVSSGAGGAGWYGGGSGGVVGAGSSAFTSIGRNGGGGSSYTDNSCTEVIHTQGYNDGTGYITISYVVESTESDYDYYTSTYITKIFKKTENGVTVYRAVKQWKKGQYYGN